MKKLKCPICGKLLLAEIDEKGNLTYFDGDFWTGTFHRCRGRKKGKK
jgi:hypothetical protein